MGAPIELFLGDDTGPAIGRVVPDERIELPTFGLQNRCSTAELNRLTPRGARKASP